MSGPKTSHYRLSAARRLQEERLQAERRKRREELAARFAAAQTARIQLEKKLARLSATVDELRRSFPSEKLEVAFPDCKAPETEDPRRLEDFVGSLERDLLQAELAVRRAGERAKANDEFVRATRGAATVSEGTPTTASEAMQRFMESKRATISVTSTKLRQDEIDRILGRHGAEAWLEAPASLERLVMEALSVESESRFSALCTEIRLQIQELTKAEKRRRDDARKAKALLGRLDIEVPSGENLLKQRLELVTVGALPYSEHLERRAQSALAKAAESEKATLQRSASEIVSETLADLGYEVGSIEETLFARGGKVYFRKSGWADYCVRLTVRPEKGTMNFNVVRVAEVASERSSREADIKAENAWCSGYSELVDTLAARGLETELTRHLPVGAVPVQTVSPDEVSISAFGTNARKRRTLISAKRLGTESK